MSEVPRSDISSTWVRYELSRDVTQSQKGHRVRNPLMEHSCPCCWGEETAADKGLVC